MSPVVSCLVQLMLDAECRTTLGFQKLIQREWVVMGHPFLDRLGHLVQPRKNKKDAAHVSEGRDVIHTVSYVKLGS